MEQWSKQILSIIQPMAYAAVIGKAKRAQLLGWAETLEAVAAAMRSRAGG